MQKLIYGDIQKSEDQADGTIIVSGYASSGAIDSAGEIITKEAMEKAIPDYMKFANIREMHQPLAAGVALKLEVQEDGRTFIEGHIVDKVAVTKVKTGVYKGFSIGGRYVKRDDDDFKRVTEIKLSEISLVDRPANPDAVLSMWKGENMTQPNKTEDAPANQTPPASTTTPPAEDIVHKTGARHSKADMERLQEIHDHSVGMGAACDAEKYAGTEGLQKIQNEKRELVKTLGVANVEIKKLADENEALKKRVSELEAMPAGTQPALKTVSKADDHQQTLAANNPDDIAKEKDPMVQLKKIFQNGPKYL